MNGIPINRIVAIVAAVISLALGLLPVIANLDWTSTAGVIAGIAAILGYVLKWLEGWQKHEAMIANPDLTPIGTGPSPVTDDQGDVGRA